MRIIDLTHTISENMPVYPGTEKPELTIGSTYEEHGFCETLLRMYSHTGTHMDAPSHLFASGTTLDKFDASQFIGSAVVIDCSDLKEGGRIDISYINSNRTSTEKADFLLFRTDWDKRWGTDEYFADYPYITDEVADFIIATKKKGIGLDVIGVDPISDSNLTLHKKLLCQNTVVIIENLCNLELVGNGLFTLVAAPLKYANSDGAPIRALAVLD